MAQKIKCKIHQLPAQYFDYSKDSQKKLLCLKCITARFPFQSIEEFDASQLKKLNQINTLCEQSLNLLKNLIETITSFKHEILQSIEKLLQNRPFLEKIKIQKKRNFIAITI